MKQRLDMILVEKGLAPSRAAAQAMIMAGEVSHRTAKLTKPGQMVDVDIDLEVAEKPRYVSRGGDKLASVAAELSIDFAYKIVLDVGSSTGGFTDYALQNGATKVYAVDVGTNQLAYSLRQDPRVQVMEQADIRNVRLDDLDPTPELAVIDVSFISLTKILPAVKRLLADDGLIVAMAKPQFESDKATADSVKGVVKDETLRKNILANFEAAIKPEFKIIRSADSGVSGAKGNRERFYLLQ